MKLLTTSTNLLNSLAKIDIMTSEDVFNHLPYRYEDNSYTEDEEISAGKKVTLLGKLVSNPKLFKNTKLEIITFYFVTISGKFFNVKIFNRSYLMKILSLGEEYTIIGTYSLERKEINAQSIVKGKIPSNQQLRSVYHLPSEVSNNIYRRLVNKTFETYYDAIIDEIPLYLKTKYHLLNKNDALKFVHLPKDYSEIDKGLRTLKYHECLLYCLKNQIIRGENKRIPSIDKSEKIDTKKINEFILNLPFKLTKDQIVAIREIILDMNKKELMYRLLQGDVGTGKTIVSALSLYGNFLRNKVGAFMVPTDSLARQQYEYLKNLFSIYNIKVGLLIGSLSSKEKNIVKENLKNGEINVIVGTHALFSSDVIYSSLGLAIIDEQHRFGVNQRNELISKDETCDLLLMSATPIPRTLALSIYGDLDISSLNMFPNKERKVVTKVVNTHSTEIISSIKDCLNLNRQVFVVAPKITDEKENFTSVEKIYEIYSTLFPNQVCLLHGKMKSEEKDKILQRFINKEFLILVSTTVIELGINVLSAGLIIIYSANNFGLASLHQLRGRVGRDGQEAICLLVNDNAEDERLKILENSNDGFYIAEMDMKLRGPGDTTGLAQSGFPTFSCLNIVDDFKMFECARDDAKNILNNLQDNENKRYYDYALKRIALDNTMTLFD